MSDAFFTPLGEGRWLPTAHTAGPWSAQSQHGGPPAALLARAVETCAPREDMVFARVTCEILGAVPVAELALRSRVERPGRSVEMITAALSAGGRDVMTATAWRVRRATESTATESPPPPPLRTDRVDAFLANGRGYLGAIEWRMVHGGFLEPGPCAAWTRLRVTVVPDEEVSPLQRVMAVADSGNGISQLLDMRQWYFINPELTVHLHREAVGEWVLMDAVTSISAGGAGLATSVLSDAGGEIGRGAQALLVAAR